MHNATSDEDDQDLPKALAETARRCPKPEVRAHLQECAVDVSNAIDAFARHRSASTLRHLQSVWSRALVVLDAAVTEQDPQPPVSGAPEVAELAA